MQRLRNRVGWLWRQLRLGTWFPRRKAEKVVTVAAATSDERVEPDTDRVSGRTKGSTSSQRRGKARGGPNRRRKKKS
jgi:hypothetical protein